MTVNEFPDRIICIDDAEYLYFGGTNYLGITTNTDFQNILFESIKKWGTSYGSSRNSNIQLSVYEKAEKLLAKNIHTEAALVVSSGMLAGKLVVEYLSNTMDAMFHLQDVHPAIKSKDSQCLIIDGKLNPKILDSKNSEIIVFTDSIPSTFVQPVDLNILLEIPENIQITLVIDESHSLGIYDYGWQKIAVKENINLIKVSSLGKAIGISGGVIAGSSHFISSIRNQDSFVGSSGMNPALLETYCNAQSIYTVQKQKLDKNLTYLDTHFKNRNGFTFHKNYPVIYFDDETISKKLFDNKITITSFNYPAPSGKLNRIVITANHIMDDLDQLISILNTI